MFAQRARTPVLSSRSRAGPAGPSPLTGLADGFGPEVALPRWLADSPQQTWVPGSSLPRWGQLMTTQRRRPVHPGVGTTADQRTDGNPAPPADANSSAGPAIERERF